MSAASKKAPELLDHLAWLGYTQRDSEGLVVSAPALVGSQVIIDRARLPDLQDAFAGHVTTLDLDDSDTGDTAPGIADLPRFFFGFLGWPADLLVGWDASRPVPESLSVSLPEFQETLAPTYALSLAQPKEGESPWLLLIQAHPPTTDLTKPVTAGERGWGASPAKKFERLLREKGIPIGLLTNGVAFQLVYAPPKENSGTLTFPVAPMLEVSGRLILGAFHRLLHSGALFTVPSPQRLPALLQTSRSYQATVSEKLAEQVLHALYELLRGFVAAERQAKTTVLHELAAKRPEDVYGGLVTVLLRLVFVLFAEDRGLLPTSGLFVRHYSVRGLFERLRADAERHPDTMEHRFGAWAQLLALFRLIHGGCQHEEMRMPAREGHLFDPQRYPFLEGRAHRDEAVGALPLVSDGVIYSILEKLCILEGERVSYRTLDVEEIGSVYQTIMGFGVEVVSGTAIALKGKRKKGSVPAAPVVDLEDLLARKPADRVKFLDEQADTKLPTEAEKALKAAMSVDDLLAALNKRIDSKATPAPVTKGGLILQPNDERRRSGSHYTPRSFTGPIVRKTLEPVLARLVSPELAAVPADQSPTPDQILDLKVADIAVGSAAFLVEACRQLGDALVKAWRVHKKRPALPADETEELLAMRLVAQRCLYGVDRNPMAVDLAKLSLWLATLAKDHPFTFLDHTIRCGDSLVGLTQKQIEAFTWEEKTAGKQRVFGQEFLEKRIQRATKHRREILEAGDFVLPALKAQILKLADEELDEIRFLGDLIVSAFFSFDKDKARVEKLDELKERYIAWHNSKIIDPTLKPRDEVRGLRENLRPFHWEIEFPEVFGRAKSGFDAIVGNPPFIGGRLLRRSIGDAQFEYLLASYSDSSGNADIVAFFFRRCFALINKEGTQGLIATNTISQGDTRGTGLRWICANQGTIYAAQKRVKWPGSAAVIVSIVWISRIPVRTTILLNNQPVEKITAYLFHKGSSENPATLNSNEDGSFQGAIILGMGFTFDDTDKTETASKLAVMNDLIAKNPKNRERIFPYIGGEEVNEDPWHRHNRYTINFFDFPLEKSSQLPSWSKASEKQKAEMLRSGTVPNDYPWPVATEWPDLLDIVVRKVKDERTRKKPNGDFVLRSPLPIRWWQFADKRPALTRRLELVDHALVIARVSQHYSVARVQSRSVFSEQLVVMPTGSYADACIIQSRVHEIWARFFSSSFGDGLRYTPTDCYETYPFPQAHKDSTALASIGRKYFERRSSIMTRAEIGLTDLYNRFHDPEVSTTEIQELRLLHEEMDKAVLEAYGWSDIPTACQFLLDYEDDENSDVEGKPGGPKKPWRYRWPESVREEVLARLLTLNTERAEQERLTKRPLSKPAVKKVDSGAKRGRKPKAEASGVAPTQADLIPPAQGDLFV